MKTFFTFLGVLLLASTANAGTFSRAAWTDDASTGIVSGQTVWASHFGVATTTTVNGVSVTGVAGPTASNANFDLAGTTNVFNGDSSNLTALTGTGSADIAHDFVYGGHPASITLKALTVGQTYTVSVLSVAFEDAGTRVVNFASGSDSLLVDQGEFGDNNGIRVDYTFTATAATRGITITPANVSNATFHLYGLALRTAAAPTTVTTANESGFGSLRWALTNAADRAGADTVTFATGFTGPIVLSTEIVINDTSGTVAIDASALSNSLTIDGGPGSNRIFSVSAGSNLSLSGLKLTGGNGQGAAQSGEGGAIINFGTLALTRCTISGNATTGGSGSGGGILNSGTALTLTECTLAGNSAVSGGAIFELPGSTLTMTRCTLNGNSSSDSGGAIYQNFGSVTLTQCTFAGNSANGDGGAIRQASGTLTLTHCTLSGNTATIAGGAVYSAGDMTVSNSIVAGNTSGGPPDIRSTTITATGINFIGNTASSGLTAGPTILTGDPLLGALASNGGATQTIMPRLGSPVIDAVTAGNEVPGLTTDQRGFPRTLDGDGTGGAAPDLGAFELARVIVTTEVDELDTPSSGGAGISLREALRDGGADLIVFAEVGAIPLNGSEIVVNDPTRRITLDATGLPNTQTIDGHSGSNRIFTVSAGCSLSLIGLKLSGGNGQGASQTGNGGAILNFGTLALTRCTLSGNTLAAGSGGAVLNDGGSATLTQCTLSGNAAANGGAIHQNAGTLSLTQCTFSGNTASAAGGAISLNAGTLTLSACTFTTNAATSNGGAVHQLAGSVTATQCTFFSNTSSQGGAAYQAGGSLSLIHCTASGNKATVGGGGIFSATSLTMTNSIIAGNSSPSGADVSCVGITPTGINFIGDLAGSGLIAGPTILTGDPRLGPLASNGGPTQTLALGRGSSAIDAVSAGYRVPGLTTDQRGQPRAMDGDNNGSSNPDLGAFELASIIVTTTADELDPVSPDGTGISLREALRDGTDLITFDPGITGPIVLGSEIVVNDPTRSPLIDATTRPDGMTIDGGPGANRIFTVDNGTSLSLTGLTLTGGHSSVNGGAILITSGTLTLSRCTLHGNSATSGGAVYVGYGTALLSQCTLSDNFGFNGGAIYGAILGTSKVTLTHCTLSGNSAVTAGGGIYVTGNDLTLVNSIVAGNTATNFADLRCGSSPAKAIGINFIGDLSGSGLTAGEGVGDNIFTLTGDPLIAPLASNGGSTPTMALRAGSLAIDTAYPDTGLTTDQRGFPRNLGGVSDLGAFESQTIVVTTTADELDTPSSGGAGISLREAVRDAPDLIIFAQDFTGPVVLGSEIVVSDTTRTIAIDAGSLPSGLTLDGGPGTNRLFTVSTGSRLSLSNLTLTGGNGDGAIYPGHGNAIINLGTLTLHRCTLSGNTSATGHGGAINQASGTATLTNCTLVGNQAGGGGGAIHQSAGTMTLTNCTLVGNQAGGGIGGAISRQLGVVTTLTHCTVFGNKSSGGGGGVVGSTGMTLVNTIIAGNSATASGQDLFAPSGVSVSGVNFIGNLSGTSLIAGPGILTGDPLLGPLARNGGPTQTMAPKVGSPVLDAATTVAGLTTDQRGFPRKLDGDGSGTAASDIGAFEASRVIVTTTADELDAISSGGAGISLREAVRDASDIITFAPGFTGPLVLGSEIVVTSTTRSIAIDAGSLTSGLTIDGGPGTNRIFTVNPGTNLSLTGLTLTGGNGTGLTANGRGGAILNFGSLTLTRCTLSGNASPGAYGGAIFSDRATLVLTQCTLSGNSISSGGGAIFQNEGTATLTQCTLSGNTAPGGGGAIASLGSMELTSCTFHGNSAVSGGALFARGSVTLTHCTLAGNTAMYGGAIQNDGISSLTLTNCIVAENTASYRSADIENAGTLATTGINLIGDLSGYGLTAGPTILTGDPLLRPLANNGGPTQTMALRPGSPAIDAATAISGLTTDQRGFPRKVDGDGDSDGFGFFSTTDLGAFELAPALVTTAVDELDAVGVVGTGVSLREALRDYSGQDTIAFAPDLAGQTFVLNSQLSVVTNVTIDAGGLSNGITISGGGNVRLFTVNTGRTVTLRNLTLSDGKGVGGGLNGIGGAIYNNTGATLTLESCTLTGHSTNIGGAIFNNGGVLTLTGCTLSGNSANSTGGAVHSLGTGSLAALGCTFSGNSAIGSGGALYTGGTTSLTQCTFTGNAGQDGGGIYNQFSSLLALTHCTLSLNTATGAGGGIYNSYSALTLANCIVAENTAATGADIMNSGSTPLGTATVTRVGINIIKSHANSGNSATDNGPSSINAAPLLSPIANYGGPTQTMPPQPGSPALDQASVLNPALTTDQRGFPRPLGLRPDIGAVEGTVIMVTTPVDELDAPGSPGAGLSLREAVRDVPAGGTIAFDRGVFHSTTTNTITLTKGPLNPQRNCTLNGSLNPGGIKIVQVPAISAQPQLQSVASNAPANFTITVTNLSGGVAYAWRKNGTANGNTTAALNFASAQDGDEGVYDVVLSEAAAPGTLTLTDVLLGAFAATSQPASLIVEGSAVAIQRHPANAMIAIGSSHTLSVVAAGPGTLTYQWTLNGKNISGATKASYLIAKAALTHAGTYRCVVKSGATTAPSDPAEIGVVDTTPKTVSLLASATASFTATVNAAGNGPLTYAWLKNGGGTAFTTKSLVINPAAAEHAGLYTCTVTGAAGVFTGGAPTLLTVSNAAPQIVKPLNLPAATIGQTYFYQIPIVNVAGAPATAFTVGGLPPGMTWDKLTGIISGRPTASTKPLGYPLTIKASNPKSSDSTTATLLLNIVPAGAVGVFAGPLERSPLNDNLGGRFDLVTTATGTFSGSLTLGARTKIGFTAKILQSAGAGDVILYGSIPGITLADKTPLIAYVEIFAIEQRAVLTLLHPNGTTQQTIAWRNPWLLSKTPALNNPATPFAATYTARLDVGIGGTVWPSGYGYTSFTVKTNGTLTLAGKLPDGSAITGGAFVSKDGEIALFNLLYSNRNTHVGKLVITPGSPVTNNTLAGTTSWWKPTPLANSTDTIYKGGFFGVPVTFAGAPYVAPGKGAIVPGFTAVALGSTNAKLNFTLGNLDVEAKEFSQLLRIYNPSATGLPNKGTPTLPLTNTTKLTTLDAAKGLFTGSFVINGATTALNRPAPFEGLIVKIGATTQGYGFFLLPTATPKISTSPKLSGRVVLRVP
jgi:hypothetical protein